MSCRAGRCGHWCSHRATDSLASQVSALGPEISGGRAAKLSSYSTSSELSYPSSNPSGSPCQPGALEQAPSPHRLHLENGNSHSSSRKT